MLLKRTLILECHYITTRACSRDPICMHCCVGWKQVECTANKYLPDKELIFSMEVVSLRKRNVLLYPPFSPPASH